VCGCEGYEHDEDGPSAVACADSHLVRREGRAVGQLEILHDRDKADVTVVGHFEHADRVVAAHGPTHIHPVPLDRILLPTPQATTLTQR
jgi:hypothetical protein